MNMLREKRNDKNKDMEKEMCLVFENKQGEKELTVFKCLQNLYWALHKLFILLQKMRNWDLQKLRNFPKVTKLRRQFTVHINPKHLDFWFKRIQALILTKTQILLDLNPTRLCGNSSVLQSTVKYFFKSLRINMVNVHWSFGTALLLASGIWLTPLLASASSISYHRRSPSYCFYDDLSEYFKMYWMKQLQLPSLPCLFILYVRNMFWCFEK